MADTRSGHQARLTERVVLVFGDSSSLSQNFLPYLTLSGARVVHCAADGSDRKRLGAEIGLIMEGEAPTDVVFSPTILFDGALSSADELAALNELVDEVLVPFVHLVQVCRPLLLEGSADPSPTITALLPASGGHLVAGRARSGVISAALTAAVRQFANELGPDGIRVNAVLVPHILDGTEEVGRFVASVIAFAKMITAETFDISGISQDGRLGLNDADALVSASSDWRGDSAG